MGKYHGLDGRQITQRVREEIGRAGVTMDVTAAYDHLPDEHRARIRAEQTAEIQRARSEGRAALKAWADDAEAAARKRYSAPTVGTAAEESRRVADELRIGRLVDSARSGGTPKAAALDIADRAERSFLAGDHDEAMVLARAAQELGSTSHVAAEIMLTVQLDRDLADPGKAKALRALRDIDVVAAAFDRDVLAATSRGLQDAAKLARALGENATGSLLAKEAAEASVRAKMEAFYGSRAFGDGTYQEPSGTLPGVPTNLQAIPDGARLPVTRN